jgi:hypothetical protein
MGDGRLNKCKECTKRDVSANYRANVDHYVKYERERNATPTRRAARYDYLRNKRSSEKRLANIAVGNAVRDGRLTKRPCEKCGKLPAEAHHDDYSKPLDVRWLCRPHHLEYHGKQSRVTESEARLTIHELVELPAFLEIAERAMRVPESVRFLIPAAEDRHELLAYIFDLLESATQSERAVMLWFCKVCQTHARRVAAYVYQCKCGAHK